jgi:tetratricopeptide (TPR) repeat protein
VAYVYADRGRAWPHMARAFDPAILEADGRRDLELGRKLGYAWMQQVGYTRTAFALFVQGHWDDAIDLAQESARLETGSGLGHFGRLVLLHAYRGEKAEALRAYERFRDRFPRSGEHNRFGAWDSFLAALEGLALLGEYDEVARHVDLAVAAAVHDRLFRGWDMRLQHTVAGIALACARRFDEAEPHLREAVRLADGLPYLVEQPESRRFYAWMLLLRGRSGDAERASSLLKEALPVYRRIGMPRHEQLATSMLHHTA